MQGKYGSENALPLNELLTVVLISHNRPAFLRRAVQFYSALPCKVLILDSSAELTEGVAGLFASMEYQHLPHIGYWGIQAKLDYGVRQVTTPYMVFAADDDFIVHDALEQSVSFLQANPDYGMCHGYCLMYLTLANSVSYYRRDKKVSEDYASDVAQDRILDFMGEYIPPFYAVHRTSLLRDWYDAMPDGTIFQWQEIGHAWYMLARAKARILPIPYVVREINYISSEHSTEIFHTLTFTDPESVADRERFAGLLAAQPTQFQADEPQHAVASILESFAVLADNLRHRRSLTAELIFESSWSSATQQTERRFGPRQYVEMPFYNQRFFELLSEYEFMLHAMPAGRVQLEGLEGVWTRQQELMRPRNNDTPESVVDRLWLALDCNMFNREVVSRLAHQLNVIGDDDEAQKFLAWEARLNTLPDPDNHQTFDATRSGRLLKWLDARNPDISELQLISDAVRDRDGVPSFGLLVLNLDGDVAALQVTLDSLLEGHCKAFKIVVFTTAEPPAATTADNTLHFVKVSQTNHVDKLNQSVRQLTCEWLLLANAGDQFTASGLLRASLELLAAPQCRAVYADEIHRQANGALVDVFRPDFNLDLLQTLPGLMARHWLVRRDVLVDAGGYSAEFANALEFDLLLRIIEQGGMAWLAHMSEPLLICDAPVLEENVQERQALSRHLTARGYKALITSEPAGTYQIDYRHSERPLVSIIVHGQSELIDLQRCVTSILQRTRYTKFEVLIGQNRDTAPATLEWLAAQPQPNGRIRLIESENVSGASALINHLARHAKGEYLILLASDSEVVSPNWVGSLLNQAMRPEVGVVGGKLIDSANKVTQAGLILGLNDGVGSGLVGSKNVPGYMHRLILTQNYSAVSSTCMMIRKALFDAVEGFNEDAFAEVFADIDLCLNIGQAGYLVVWTPQVQITHPGVLADAPQALAALRDKWAGSFDSDPAYNKNLSLTGNGFDLGTPSAVNWAQLLA